MTAAENLAPPSPAELLKEKFWGLKRSRIRLSHSHTTRASSIGNDCERFLFYERTASELRTPHTPELQAIFDLGNQAERYVVAELGAMGFDVLERSRDYFDRARELTGHIDGKLAGFGLSGVPMEAKGLNPFTADKVEKLEDIRDSRQAWVRKYYAQLQVYLHLDRAPLGVFVLLNKSTGAITFIDCPYDEPFALEMMARAERVRDAVKANEPLPRKESGECARCAFAHVCLPDRTFGEGVQVLDEPELIAAIERREMYRAAKKAFDEADAAVKEWLPKKPGELLIGDYVAIGNEVHRKAYTAKATSFVQWSVRPKETQPVAPKEK